MALTKAQRTLLAHLARFPTGVPAASEQHGRRQVANRLEAAGLLKVVDTCGAWFDCAITPAGREALLASTKVAL